VVNIDTITQNQIFNKLNRTFKIQEIISKRLFFESHNLSKLKIKIKDEPFIIESTLISVIKKKNSVIFFFFLSNFM